MAISPPPRLLPPRLPRQLALPLPPPPMRAPEADSGPPLPPQRLWATLALVEREQIRRGVLRVVLEVAHECAVVEP